MKSVIVYYSMSGNCEMVAEKIAGIIDADIIRIEPKKAYPDSGAKKFIWGGKSAVMGEKPPLKDYEFDADKYERVIFGFPVWASSPTPPIRTFVNENRDALKGKKIAAYTCLSGSGAGKALEKLRKLLDIDSFEAELVLIDPKTNVKVEDDKKIEEFCKRL